MSADTLASESTERRSFDEVIDTTDREAFTTSVISEIKERGESELMGKGWYTEILEDKDGQPVIVPVPPDIPHQQASAGNNHSVLDEIRHGEGEYRRDHERYIAFADANELETSKVRAKGVLSYDVTGKLQLIIQENRGLPLKAITQLLTEVPAQGIDGGIKSELLYENTPSFTYEVGHKPYYQGHIGYSTERVEPFDSQYRTAVATEISLKNEKGFRDGKIVDAFNLRISGTDAFTPLHQPIYESLGIEDPSGLVDVEYEGKHYEVGVRHTIDHKNNRIAVNLFFGEDYGKDGKLLEHIIVEHYRDYLYGYSDMEVVVTVSDSGTKPARQYGLEVGK